MGEAKLKLRKIRYRGHASMSSPKYAIEGTCALDKKAFRIDLTDEAYRSLRNHVEILGHSIFRVDYYFAVKDNIVDMMIYAKTSNLFDPIWIQRGNRLLLNVLNTESVDIKIYT